MSLVARFTFATALSLSAAALVATPASAQRRQEQQQSQQAQQPELQLSRQFRGPAGDAQTKIQASDWAGAEAPLAQAEQLASTDDERYFASWLRLQLELGRNTNPAAITTAIDTLLANTRTPQNVKATLAYERGRRAILAGQRREAIPFLVQARQLGSEEAALPLLLASAYFDVGQNAEGLVELDRAITAREATGQHAPEEWYNLGVAKLYNAGGDQAETARWMMRQVRAYPTVQNWRRVLVLYRDSSAAASLGRLKIDFYRLMQASGALAGQADYFEYAEAASNAGLPWEVISLIDQGRSTGTVPRTGDNNFAPLYTRAQTALRAESPASTYETRARAAADGRQASQTGDIYLASANYPKAVEMYQLALSKGGVDAPMVNLRLGEALARMGRDDDAKAALALAGTTGPAAEVARFWTTWIDLPDLVPATPAAPAAPAAN